MIWLTYAVLCTVLSFANTSLSGLVVDEQNNPVLFADVAVYLNGVLVTGTQTDFDGHFQFENIDPGVYDIMISYVGLNTVNYRGVIVFANRENVLEDIVMSSGIKLDVDIVVVDYSIPLIEQDATSSSRITTAEQIRNLPVKDINAIATQSAGLSAVEGDNISIGGGRTNQTNYYIDGVRFNSRHSRADRHSKLERLSPAILICAPIPSDLAFAQQISSENDRHQKTSFLELRDEFGQYLFINEDENFVLNGVIEARINEFELRRYRP